MSSSLCLSSSSASLTDGSPGSSLSLLVRALDSPAALLTPIEIPFTPMSEIPFTPKGEDTFSKSLEPAGDENVSSNILSASNCTQVKVPQLRELFEQRISDEKVSADKLRHLRAPSAEARLCIQSLPMPEKSKAWFRGASATLRRDRYKHLEEHRETRDALLQHLRATGAANFLSPFKSPASDQSSPLQDELSPATGLALEQIKSNRDLARVQTEMLKIVKCLALVPAECGGLLAGTGGDGSTGLLKMENSPQPSVKHSVIEPPSAEKNEYTGLDVDADDDADTGADSQASEVAVTMDSGNTSSPPLEEEAECEEPEKVSLEESPRGVPQSDLQTHTDLDFQELSEIQDSACSSANSLRLPEAPSLEAATADRDEDAADALAETSRIEEEVSPSASSRAAGEGSDEDFDEEGASLRPDGESVPFPCQESLPRHLTMLHALEQQEMFQEVLVTVPELPSAERWVQFEYGGQPIQIQVPEGYEPGQQMPVALQRKKPPLERSKELMNVRGHSPFQFMDRSGIVERLKHCPRANGRQTALGDEEMKGRHMLYRTLRGREMQPLLPDTPEECEEAGAPADEVEDLACDAAEGVVEAEA